MNQPGMSLEARGLPSLDGLYPMGGDGVGLEDFTVLEAPQYQSVDSIPEVASVRAEKRDYATNLLECRREQRQRESRPYESPVDALSTAHAVLQAKDPAERAERLDGLVLDCKRLVAEWVRKKKAEKFPIAEHEFDAGSEDYFSHGMSVGAMTENALIPLDNNSEEESRRINEYVEEATVLPVKRALGALATDYAIRTVSQCTDKAINDYQYDVKNKRPHRGYNGYVPEIEKVMIRDLRFREGTDSRFEEQVGLSGLYVNHYIIQTALERSGMEASHLDKTRLHGTQFLAKDSLMGFVALLDEVASEQWCTNIFMGEQVDDGFVKDYEAFEQEALERQANQDEYALTVANYVLDLAEDNVDRNEAPAMVEHFVKRMLLNMAKDNDALVEQMFDAKTAEALREVSRLEQAGQHDAAFMHMERIVEAAPGGGACGSGCGVTGINRFSKEGAELMKLLKANSTDEVGKDSVRACKCGKRTIAYAFNSSMVKKVCTSCHRSETKFSKVPTKTNYALAS